MTLVDLFLKILEQQIEVGNRIQDQSWKGARENWVLRVNFTKEEPSGQGEKEVSKGDKFSVLVRKIYIEGLLQTAYQRLRNLELNS
jgi:hypothetical protein